MQTNSKLTSCRERDGRWKGGGRGSISKGLSKEDKGFKKKIEGLKKGIDGFEGSLKTLFFLHGMIYRSSPKRTFYNFTKNLNQEHAHLKENSRNFQPKYQIGRISRLKQKPNRR
ncbi:hypothetical protein Ccrd_010106 [Cynara cardunculus var. scolymus]|uniref:Uncharacterized protein n=1 Tax=Cynara cardunculus var. scolymus TaxID=59895 RepID=A0A103YLQ8_CYNCS|nr:hypothetical protein Ccrd_010106 [Cynara cardunculus var. scolymus]